MFEGTVWGRSGDLTTRAGELPPWRAASPVWAMIAGDPATAQAEAAAFSAAVGVPGVEPTYHWYGWNNEAFDTYYPNLPKFDPLSVMVT